MQKRVICSWYGHKVFDEHIAGSADGDTEGHLLQPTILVTLKSHKRLIPLEWMTTLLKGEFWEGNVFEFFRIHFCSKLISSSRCHTRLQLLEQFPSGANNEKYVDRPSAYGLSGACGGLLNEEDGQEADGLEGWEDMFPLTCKGSRKA